MIRLNNKYGFVKTMNAVVSLIIFSLCLAACSSSETPPLQTQEFFTTRVNDGQTQFAFGLAWQMEQDRTEEEGSKGVRQSAIDNNARFAGGDRGPRYKQLGKQGKLQLEDQAAEKLQAQIDSRGLCENGHKVEQVIWEVGRIRLMGHCL